jgi:uncharacterized membrane protein YjjB (DUF3815 family)
MVEQKYSLAYSTSIQTIAVGGSIAFGIMLSSTTFRFMSQIIRPNKKESI